MRPKLLVCLLVLTAFLAGFFTAGMMPEVTAQEPSSRFAYIRDDGPFRMWKDTQTDQCFIVTTPYFAMLTVGSC